jgi:hypothetical protein
MKVSGATPLRKNDKSILRGKNIFALWLYEGFAPCGDSVMN